MSGKLLRRVALKIVRRSGVSECSFLGAAAPGGPGGEDAGSAGEWAGDLFLTRLFFPHGLTLRMRAPIWIRRGSQLLQTMFLGVTSMLCGLIALNLLLGYIVISPLPNQVNEPFGEMLSFALTFTGAFVAHVLIWRPYPGGSWWSPPDAWPPQGKHSSPDRAHGPAAP